MPPRRNRSVVNDIQGTISNPGKPWKAEPPSLEALRCVCQDDTRSKGSQEIPMLSTIMRGVEPLTWDSLGVGKVRTVTELVLLDGL